MEMIHKSLHVAHYLQRRSWNYYIHPALRNVSDIGSARNASHARCNVWRAWVSSRVEAQGISGQ